MYYVDGLYVVSHMMYDDIQIEQEDGYTIGKDFQVWFSD